MIYACNPSYLVGVGKWTVVQEGTETDPIQKNIAKRTGSVTQVVEHLPTKRETLNSTLESHTHKKTAFHITL